MVMMMMVHIFIDILDGARLEVCTRRFENAGMRLVDIQMMTPSQRLAESHYCEHRSRSFFKDVVQYLTSGPVCAMLWEGDDAVRTARSIVGSTDPEKAQTGTIRRDFATCIERNVIHASDSPEAAQRECELWFRR